MKHEIISDKHSVWVNSGVTGACLGRFGRRGIDIHYELGQSLTDSECLSCTHAEATSVEWSRFVFEMRKFHGVVIAKRHKPQWCKERPSTPHS